MPGPKPDQAGAKSSSMAFQSQGLQLGQAIAKPWWMALAQPGV